MCDLYKTFKSTQKPSSSEFKSILSFPTFLMSHVRTYPLGPDWLTSGDLKESILLIFLTRYLHRLITYRYYILFKLIK